MQAPYQHGRRSGGSQGRGGGGNGLVPGCTWRQNSRSNSSCRLLVYGVNETGLNLSPARSEKGPGVPCSGEYLDVWFAPPERAAMGKTTRL